ncbi:hypothetical protein GE09DRAFT_211632 [Coniochaeta sp. 2T2.1]|nr:hypothetical protein GE09DRAFT_211632 [Coniochaeta sp. 2T2.1]
MDDPWGSPWTTATPASRERTPSPTKSDLEPPPRAFISTNGSPRLPAVSVASPWADDNDGFGDWASADNINNSTATSTSGVHSASGWAGGWGGTGSDTPGLHGHQHLSPTPKEEGFGFAQASPIAWPGSIALSPGYKNGNGSAFRQPSPDPWASEFDDFRKGSDAHSTPSFVLDRPATPSSPAKQPETEVVREESASAWNEDGLRAVVDETAEGSDAISRTAEDAAHGTADTKELPDTLEPEGADQSRPSTSSKPRSSHSRSSSTSRHDSDSEGDRQDSPITSIDEDARSRIALPPRKVSGRIQVLVEKFDGLAKAASDENLPVRRESTPRKGDAFDAGTPSEEVGDFGDFEDAEEDPPMTPVRESRTPSPRTSLERTPTPRVRAPETPIRQRPASAATASPNVKSPVAKRAPVHFDVDLSQIDGLFNDPKQDPVVTHGTLDSLLPDHIITDSFSEISERKAWYRISRQGSSRMHNSGDAESYRRVAWPTTTVHEETLKIVRRWMEQDSITGRTTLGGSGNRTNMFNWDSAAEPVALEQIFAKRRRPQRPVSLQQPPKVAAIIPPARSPLAGAANGAAAPPKQRPMSLVGASTGAFGWSTSPVTQQSAKQQPNAPTTAVQPETRPLDMPPKKVLDQKPAPLNPPAAQEDDDDDWGEMMSSPPVNAKPMTLPGFGGAVSLLPDTSPLPGAPLPPSHPPPTIRPTADTNHTPLPDLWAQPPPSPPIIPPNQTATVQQNPERLPSYFGLPPKPTVTTSMPASSAAFTPTTPLEILSPLPLAVVTPIEPAKPALRGKNEMKEDDQVRDILEGLPDLSYMLR